MRLKIALFLLPLLLLASACTTFGRETKEYSATVTPMMTRQLAFSNVCLGWLRDILKNYQTRERARAVAEAKAQGIDLKPEEVTVMIEMDNPAYDPEKIDETGEPVEPPYIPVDVQTIINSIEHLIAMNFEMAKAMDTLDASIQEDRGLDPLFQQVKEVLTDEQVAALIKAYGAKLLERAGVKGK